MVAAARLALCSWLMYPRSRFFAAPIARDRRSTFAIDAAERRVCCRLTYYAARRRRRVGADLLWPIRSDLIIEEESQLIPGKIQATIIIRKSMVFLNKCSDSILRILRRYRSHLPLSIELIILYNSIKVKLQ
ncbi:unnamed protein product, partial [Trichogramma brassicae]